MTELAAEERQLLEFLAAREDDLLEFTRQLIATPSVNPPGDERQVAALVEAELHDLGIEDVERVGASEERPNVLARIPGRGAGPTLILNGHYDTKPAGELEAWENDPWDPVIRDGELHGLGSGDMKAAVAAILYAGAALREAGAAGDLQLVFSADEEAGAAFGSKWLAENGYLRADAALIAEPSGVLREWESIALVSRGAALFKIRIHGTQMHSSLSDRLPAVNATVAMGRLADRLHRELKGALTYDEHPLVPTGPTVNVGVMAHAGVFYGVYPGYAELCCDVRTLPGMTERQFAKDVDAFLRRAMDDDPELRAEAEVEIWIPPTEIAPDHPLVRALESAGREVFEQPLILDAFPGATDAPHFQLTAGIPTVAACGPGLLPRAHAPNERLGADSVQQAARLYALAGWRYLNELV